MILPILAAVICLAQMIKINNQAMMPIPKEYVFADTAAAFTSLSKQQ